MSYELTTRVQALGAAGARCSLGSPPGIDPRRAQPHTPRHSPAPAFPYSAATERLNLIQAQHVMDGVLSESHAALHALRLM